MGGGGPLPGPQGARRDMYRTIFLGWGTTSRSLRCLEGHVRYYVRIAALVQYFWALSNICGSCPVFWGFVLYFLAGALFSMLGFCIVCGGCVWYVGLCLVFLCVPTPIYPPRRRRWPKAVRAPPPRAPRRAAKCIYKFYENCITRPFP